MSFQELTPIIGYAVIIFIFWRQGGNSASAQLITTNSQLLTTYKEQVLVLQKQVTDLTAKLGELTGQLKEKNDRILTLEALATNRNPELEVFMKFVTESIKGTVLTTSKAEEYMKSSDEYLHAIKDVLTPIQAQQVVITKELKVKPQKGGENI